MHDHEQVGHAVLHHLPTTASSCGSGYGSVVEQLLPKLEVRGSNPVIGEISYGTCLLLLLRRQNKEKRGREFPIFSTASPEDDKLNFQPNSSHCMETIKTTIWTYTYLDTTTMYYGVCNRKSPGYIIISVVVLRTFDRAFALKLSISVSETRFGEISPLWKNIKRLWQLFEGSLSVWNDI